MGVTKPISSVPLFPIFSALSKHTLDIKYHVYIWQVSQVSVIPVKYEYDSKNLAVTFARSKILRTEKLTNGALVTPTLGLARHENIVCDFLLNSTIQFGNAPLFEL